jgi:hypothetical protein
MPTRKFKLFKNKDLSINEQISKHLGYLLNAKGPRFIRTTVHYYPTFVLESLRRYSVITN